MIRLIVAIDRNRGIARHGEQPWSLPSDMAYFVRQTKTHGGNVLVGGTTFRKDLKGKPLKGRTTYLLTRNNHPIEGIELVSDINTLAKIARHRDIWVMGGASVYKLVIDAGLADELYITHIDADFKCDQFFPEFEAAFTLSSQSDLHEENGLHFSYACYITKAHLLENS